MFKLICFLLISNLISVLTLDTKMVSEHVPGTYKLEKSENFDAFLKEMGLGLLKRQAASKLI